MGANPDTQPGVMGRHHNAGVHWAIHGSIDVAVHRANHANPGLTSGADGVFVTLPISLVVGLLFLSRGVMVVRGSPAGVNLMGGSNRTQT